MGLYLDPEPREGEGPETAKVRWLMEHGEHLWEQPASFHQTNPDRYAVVVINNGLFLAVGVAYSENELRRFSDPTDTRPREWLMVSEVAIRELIGERANRLLGRRGDG